MQAITFKIGLENNILAMFIATLFNEYEHKIKGSEKYKLDDKGQELFELFHDAQRNINYLIDGKVDDIYENNLQQLSIMSASINLKKGLKYLVDKWLEVFGKKDHKLLITIDDIDLNSTHADEMAEQIRKYLIQDNIIDGIEVGSVRDDKTQQIRKTAHWLRYQSQY